MLTIRLLGFPEILLEGSPLKVVRRKSRALLFYLAAQRQPASREQLMARLWPDLPRTSGQQVLRTTLHGLRQALGEALRTEGELLSLAAGSQVDVRRFEQALQASEVEIPRLAEALDLYRGDFLEGFDLPDSREFEDWMLVERERYRRLAVRGLAALSAAYEARQDYQAALASLDRALLFNPLQEDLQRESMRLHYLAGDRPGAIRRYDDLRRLLDDEMGVPPMAETRALYDAILTDRLAPPPAATRPVTRPVTTPLRRPTPLPGPAPSELPAPGLLPFTGRSAELETVRAQVAAHRLVLIAGEPGIGKTRLAEEFIRSGPALALTGRAHELEQAIPYQPVIAALRSLLHHPRWPALEARVRGSLAEVWLVETARLAPELAGEMPPGAPTVQPAEEARLWEGIAQFLAAVALQQPVVLFLDDLQWADASSLALLGYLVRQPPVSGLGFVATTRPFSPRSPLMALQQALLRADRLWRLELKRLTPADVRIIASATASAIAAAPGQTESEALAGWLIGVSEGNPYILAELIRHRLVGAQARARAHQSEALGAHSDPQAEYGHVNGIPGPSADSLPQTVFSLIQARLARLSGPARRVLDAGVAAGRVFEFEVAAQAAGLSETAALDALDDLQAAGLVLPQGETGFTFDHSLTMEVAYHEVGELRHRLLHRRVAEALETIHRDDLPAVAAQLAWHYAEGNAPEQAAPHALRAGQQAAALAAWAEAISFFEQALKGLTGQARLPVLLDLSEAHYRAGHFAQAADALHAALNLAQAAGDAAQVERILLALPRTLLPQGRFSEAIAVARQVRASGSPAGVVSAELMWGTALSLEGADLDEARQHLQAAADLYRANGLDDPSTLSHIQFESGSVAAQQGDLPQAVACYREALAAALAAPESDSLDQRILAYNNLAYHLHLLGNPAAADYARRGLELARGRGIAGLQTYLLSTLGEIALAAGELGEAEQHFEAGLALAERYAAPERIAGLTANLGLVAARAGQISLAIHRLSTALGLADALGTHHLAAQVRIWLAPLLPRLAGLTRLAEARRIAEQGGRKRLLDDVARLEAELQAG